MNVANSLTKKGLDGFTLKMIALGLMTIDHIYEFFAANGIPIWFTWLGRLSAPLFFFTMAEGFFYTRSKIIYVERLYLLSMVMSISKLIAWGIHTNNLYYPIVRNNIFETFFLIAFYILLFELLKDKDKEISKKIVVIFLVILLQIILPVSIQLLLPTSTSQLFGAFFPSPLLCEGNLPFIALGVTFFYLRNNRTKMMIIYCVFSLVFFPFSNYSFQNAFYHSYQWMMIFSMPLMLLYNGKKGPGLKYLFYTYYPAHIFLFFVIAGVINSK